jgi:hypothetical protein
MRGAGVTAIHGRALGVTLTALLSSLLSGCGGDDCVGGQFRCDDNVAMNCEFEDGANGPSHTWSTKACGVGACKVDDHGAFCAVGDSVDANCATSTTPEFICVEATLTGCRTGYATSTYDCATGASTGSSDILYAVRNPEGPLCISSTDGAFCAAKP